MKKLEQYTRSELIKIKEQATKKRKELFEYVAQCSASEVVKEAIRKEGDTMIEIIYQIEERLELLTSRCIFCRTKIPTEVPTITHICATCDRKIFGGGK